MPAHQSGLLGVDWFAELKQGLELIVLGERDDLHDCSKLGKDLLEDVQSDGVEHVVNDYPEHRAGGLRKNTIQRTGVRVGRATILHCRHGLEDSLCTLDKYV